MKTNIIKLLFGLLVFFASCTNFEPKQPVFSKSLEHAMEKVEAMGTFSSYEFNAKSSQVNNGHQSNDLKLTLIDWQALPENKEELDSLARKIATTLRKSIKNSNEFDWITITFRSTDQNAEEQNLKTIFTYRPGELK